MEPVTPVPAGPLSVARSVVVDAAPHDVFVLLADPHRHHEVDGSGTVRPDVIGPRDLQLGDRFRVSMKLKGIPYSLTSVVTALEPDRLVEWRHPGGHKWRWEFEPVGEGRTRVTETFDGDASPMPWLLRAIRATERNARGIESSLARLQRRFA